MFLMDEDAFIKFSTPSRSGVGVAVCLSVNHGLVLLYSRDISRDRRLPTIKTIQTAECSSSKAIVTFTPQHFGVTFEADS